MPLIRSAVVRALLAAGLFAFAGAPAGAAPGPATAPAAKAGREMTLLYGDDHAFGIVVPQGWTVDDTSGIGSRLRVVLYPRGQSWASAPTVMYVNPIHQEAGRRRTFKQMLEGSIADFRKHAPKGTVSAQRPLATGVQGKLAEVRYFAPDGKDPLEAVAYVAEDDLVMLLVLSSRDPAGFKQHLPAFESLVSGYQFVAAGIQTPTGGAGKRR